MKMYLRVLLIITSVVLVFSSFGQEALAKRVRPGFSVAFGTTMPRTNSGLFTLEKSPNLSLGYICNFAVKRKFSISTGIEASYSSIRYIKNEDELSDLIYYLDIESEGAIDQRPDVFIGEELSSVSEENYFAVLESRRQWMMTLDVPIHLQVMTNFIGFTRFFGQLGLRNSFNIFNRTKDDIRVDEYGFTGWNDRYPNTSIRTRNLHFMYTNLSLGAGLEWNYSGTKSLKIGFEYNFNITSLYRKNKDKGHLYNVPHELYDPGTVGFEPYFQDIYYHGNLPDDTDQITPENINFSQLRMRVSLFF